MSDTDDTDDLLLIPPDFFVVTSDSEDPVKFYGPYYNIVDSLITQVNKLENRINSIESYSDSSLLNSSSDIAVNTNNRNHLMSDIRKFSSWEDIPKEESYIGSTHSTPQKPRTRFKLNSLPSTPSTDRTQDGGYRSLNRRSFPHNSPTKRVQEEQNKMLNEIDNFISNVKVIQRYSAAKNLNHEFRDAIGDSGEGDGNAKPRLNLNDVDQMLHAMESQHREIESRLKEKEHQLGKKDHFYKEKVWVQGGTKESVPDRHMGMRDILYDDRYRREKVSHDNFRKTTILTSQELLNVDMSKNSESVCSDNSVSLSSSDSTQVTAYQKTSEESEKKIASSPESEKIHSNAMHVLNMHKNLLAGKSEENNPHSKGGNKSYKYQNELAEVKSLESESSSSHLALLSLSELWNHNDTNGRNFDHSKCLNKLQEEKLRRQHCEQLIQQLQSRTLELQEKVAVAMKVDRAKDEAILMIHRSWEEAFSKIDGLTSDKLSLEKRLVESDQKASSELAEASKKISRYESESSKALNLAHTTQEKLASVEKHNTHLTSELDSLTTKLNAVQNNYTQLLDKNQQILNILSQKEIELSENKQLLGEARKEVAQSKKAVEICQTELNGLKDTRTHLETHYGKELEQRKALEMERNKIAGELETHKKINKSLQEEVTKQRELNEQNKVELRNFYQDQVEIVVRDKLKEFQAQLEKAENSLQDEIRSRELQIAKAAAMHIQQISEKHALEVHLMEEKQKEERKLHRLQFSQAQQQIESLQNKLQQYQERKAQIAQQLHKVMEAQWLEALKILNNGRSPSVPQEKSTNAMDQLNSLKSRSYTNVEEILSREEHHFDKNYEDKTKKPPFLQTVYTAPSISNDDSFDNFLQPLSSLETPRTSKPPKSKQQMEGELQKYIQMLLNRSPGNPLDEPKQEKAKYYEDQADQERLNPSDKANPEGTKHKTGTRDRSGKPPWK